MQVRLFKSCHAAHLHVSGCDPQRPVHHIAGFPYTWLNEQSLHCAIKHGRWYSHLPLGEHKEDCDSGTILVFTEQNIDWTHSIASTQSMMPTNKDKLEHRNACCRIKSSVNCIHSGTWYNARQHCWSMWCWGTSHSCLLSLLYLSLDGPWLLKSIHIQFSSLL